MTLQNGYLRFSKILFCQNMFPKKLNFWKILAFFSFIFRFFSSKNGIYVIDPYVMHQHANFQVPSFITSCWKASKAPLKHTCFGVWHTFTSFLTEFEPVDPLLPMLLSCSRHQETRTRYPGTGTWIVVRFVPEQIWSQIMHHLSIIMKFEIWPILTRPLTSGLYRDLMLRCISLPKHHRCIVRSKWPKNMCCMTVLYLVDMVTSGDLTLTWPVHVIDLGVSRHLCLCNQRLLRANEAHI